MSAGLTPWAYYSAYVADFVAADPAAVLGVLTTAASGADGTQVDAWKAEIELLQACLRDANDLFGVICFEFDVPRIGSRIDAVVASSSVIVPIEFKVGEARFNRGDIEQAWDYALDLKNFHLESHQAPIVPILVATEVDDAPEEPRTPSSDLVYTPVKVGANGLGAALRTGLAVPSGVTFDPRAWANGRYRPTPTIVEAARALYGRHTVADITRNDAEATNLAITAGRVEAVIDEAQRWGTKAIVFVTGVPGAGKTLVGLDVATRKRDASSTHAVYLSGNGPLVKVLTEALSLDEVARLKAGGLRAQKGDVRQKVKSFIQNVHHFRDAGIRDEPAPPSDRVVIFDEAQRAWDLQMTADFMRRKKGRSNWSQSEAEFLLSYLDRHPDWAVVICLVGGGQEINRGEAGISAWLDAVERQFKHWRVYMSPNLADTEYAAGPALRSLATHVAVEHDEDLHLSVSMRSFRAEKVSAFVKALLDKQQSEAGSLLREFIDRYPIVLTRDLDHARQWTRDQARGSQRYGLVASSKAHRLKPDAIDVRYEIDPVHWFLRGKEDVRSSYGLEDAATEFQVQGLELDWVCVAWDADFRFQQGDWTHYRFKSARWDRVKKESNRGYLKNAYRVLLTRARQGMVLYVPRGSSQDSTRRPEYYDGTFRYLEGLGIPVI
ncbi:MAG: DUF2075 domain-containing protein [Vicinamibacterales bacterium]